MLYYNLIPENCQTTSTCETTQGGGHQNGSYEKKKCALVHGSHDIGMRLLLPVSAESAEWR
jgi:hypothetical protein